MEIWNVNAVSTVRYRNAKHRVYLHVGPSNEMAPVVRRIDPEGEVDVPMTRDDFQFEVREMRGTPYSGLEILDRIRAAMDSDVVWEVAVDIPFEGGMHFGLFHSYRDALTHAGHKMETCSAVTRDYLVVRPLLVAHGASPALDPDGPVETDSQRPAP